jgi:hypothetical protein
MRTTAMILAGWLTFAGSVVATAATPEKSADLWDRVEQHSADSNGVKIHYVALGHGPLIVMIHGFPDFWYAQLVTDEILDWLARRVVH